MKSPATIRARAAQSAKVRRWSLTFEGQALATCSGAKVAALRGRFDAFMLSLKSPVLVVGFGLIADPVDCLNSRLTLSHP